MKLTREILKNEIWLSLDPSSKIIHNVLWLRCNFELECYPSIKRISEDTGLKKTTIIKCIKKMCVLGIIRKSEKRPHHTTYYKLKNIYE